MELKLAKLPDRTPVKIPVTVSPELSASLRHYASYYEKIYGQKESVAALIPYMLQSFIDGDKAFAKALKGEEARAKS